MVEKKSRKGLGGSTNAEDEEADACSGRVRSSSSSAVVVRPRRGDGVGTDEEKGGKAKGVSAGGG